MSTPLLQPSGDFIIDWLADYMARHPEAKIPPAGTHPMVMVLGPLHLEFMSDVGGLLPCWWLLFDALKQYFPADDTIVEVKLFRNRLFISRGMASDEPQLSPSLELLHQHYQGWLKTSAYGPLRDSQ